MPVFIIYMTHDWWYLVVSGAVWSMSGGVWSMSGHQTLVVLMYIG